MSNFENVYLSAEEMVQDFFYCSIYVWYNFKALVPLANKLKDKDKFMLQSLFKITSTFTVSLRFASLRFA